MASAVLEAPSKGQCCFSLGHTRARKAEDCSKSSATKLQGSTCLAWLFEPRGSSGQSLFQKTRFAFSLFSLFHVFSVIGLAKDIYVEKFGCDVTTVGTMFMVISFWTPLNQYIFGNLQDRQFLKKWFPLETWGRRAPWFLTHLVVAASSAALVYLPPGQNQVILSIWFFLMLFLANWGASACLVAFETARVEIYPFKEERIMVEGLCKYACMFGGGSGFIPMMILLVNAAVAYRAGLSFLIFGISLLSLWSVRALMKANAPASSESVGSVMEVFRQALPWAKKKNEALRCMFFLKWWHGAYGASVATALLYYITYVLRLSGWWRNLVVGGGGFIAGLTEVICNMIYMWMFGTGDSRKDKTGRSDSRLLYFVVAMRVTNACSTMIMIGWAEPSIALFFVWCITSRTCICGFSFWRISAQCWIVDEDCYCGEQRGRRREGIIFGALNMVQNFSGSFFSSAVFIGLGVAGLVSKNCNSECQGLDTEAECVSSCFTGVIDSQPDSVRIFIRILMGFWAPFCELMVAYCAWRYPIKGMRLRKINNAIRESLGENLQEDDTPAPSNRGDLMKHMASHRASSKVGMDLEREPEANAAALAQIIEFTATRPGPKSLAVFFRVLR